MSRYIPPVTPTPLPYWTPTKLAAVATINRSTIVRMIRAGKLPAVRIGRVWRIRHSDAEALLKVDSGRD